MCEEFVQCMTISEYSRSPMDEGHENLHTHEVDPTNSELAILKLQTGDYFSNFYSRLRGVEIFQPEFLTHITNKTLEIIETNNTAAELFSSDEYKTLKERDKEQRGKCALGICHCIDGRIPTPHLIDQAGSTWETAAGILATEKSVFGDGSMGLESSRLEEAIIERAQNAEKGPLLEVLFAHTSISDPEHGCGAMIAEREKGTYPPDADLVAENLKILQDRGRVITDIYNRNVHEAKNQVATAAITGVYDTDHMGLIFGYGTESPLSTTELTRLLSPQITEAFSQSAEEISEGMYAETFAKVETFLEQKKKRLLINDYLLSNDSLNQQFNSFIEKNHPELTADQKQALKYLIVRNISFQYTTGTFEDTEHHHHPFAHHGEGYQSVSLDGITLGQYDPENQVFGANPSSAEEAIKHIKTQCTLMDKIGEAERPYILFLSKAIPSGQTNGFMENERGILKKTWTRVLQDKEIMARVRNGELCVIPTLIESKTRRVLDVPNFAR